MLSSETSTKGTGLHRSDEHKSLNIVPLDRSSVAFMKSTLFSEVCRFVPLSDQFVEDGRFLLRKCDFFSRSDVSNCLLFFARNSIYISAWELCSLHPPGEKWCVILGAPLASTNSDLLTNSFYTFCDTLEYYPLDEITETLIYRT